jgi:hypothetical protein
MPKWTEEENLILVEIFGSPETFDEQAYKLPSKTIENIQQTGRIRGLKKVMPLPAPEQIRALMADGVCRTTREIFEQSGLTLGCTRDVLRLFRKSRDIHVVDWACRPTAPIFAWGAGEDAARPEPTTMQAYRNRRRAAIALEKEGFDEIADEVLDAQFKSKAEWWPRADPVVIASINAMVHSGRAQA